MMYYAEPITTKRNQRGTDHPISYLNTLVKTRSRSIKATLGMRKTLFAGFAVRTEDRRLPKCVMFGEIVGGAISAEGGGKVCGWNVFWISETSISRPTSG